MTAEVIRFPGNPKIYAWRRMKRRLIDGPPISVPEYETTQRLLREIMADGHELPRFPGGINDLPFNELGDRPHMDLIFTEPKR